MLNISSTLYLLNCKEVLYNIWIGMFVYRFNVVKGLVQYFYVIVALHIARWYN